MTDFWKSQRLLQQHHLFAKHLDGPEARGTCLVFSFFFLQFLVNFPFFVASFFSPARAGRRALSSCQHTGNEDQKKDVFSFLLDSPPPFLLLLLRRLLSSWLHYCVFAMDRPHRGGKDAPSWAEGRMDDVPEGRAKGPAWVKAKWYFNKDNHRRLWSTPSPTQQDFLLSVLSHRVIVNITKMDPSSVCI